ncbi:KH domain-containing protein [Candidatus Parcubacteria bacterium]|nr:KH domain-containing protein [Candidatus Parcubacteria bacterium]
MSERLTLVKSKVEDLLEQLSVEATAVVEPGEEGAITVDITGQNLGALIGYHGEGLSAIQLFLSMALHREWNEWPSLYVDVEGYRREREEKVRELAQRTAQKVRFLSVPVALSPMSPFERRIIHLVVEQIEGVVTESEGTGWERHVVVKPAVD